MRDRGCRSGQHRLLRRGCLALSGRRVGLLGRGPVVDAIATGGLAVSDFDGYSAHLPSEGIAVSTSAASVLASARLILVTVKCRDTEDMARTIAQHGSPDAMVVSLQNGVRNVDLLRRHLPRHRVLAGMVPFNVVQRRDGDRLSVHRATSGTMLIEPSDEAIMKVLDVPHARTREHADMAAVQWGKLLLNLNNALNALSGLPLSVQIAQRPWRLLLAEQIREARACLKVARIRAIGTEGVPPRLVPHILRLPDALFQIIARRMLAIDPSARSSMWEDLERRRPRSTICRARSSSSPQRTAWTCRRRAPSLLP